MPARIHVAEFGAKPVVRDQASRHRFKKVLGLLIASSGVVAEANNPLAVAELECGPRRVELFFQEKDSAIREIAPDRRCERPIGLPSSRRVQYQLLSASDRRGLLGENWSGEPFHPFDIDACFGGNLRHRSSPAQPHLHLTRAEGAFNSLSGRWWRSSGRGRQVIDPCQPGLFDLLEQIIIELDDEVAVLCSAPAREYQPIVVRGQSDDVELSHRRPRRAEPAVRALLGQSSSLRRMCWGILLATS